MNTGKIILEAKDVMNELTGIADGYDTSGEFITDTIIGQVKLKKLIREGGKVDKVWYLDMKRIGMRNLGVQLTEADDEISGGKQEEQVDETPKKKKKNKDGKKKKKGKKGKK